MNIQGHPKKKKHDPLTRKHRIQGQERIMALHHLQRRRLSNPPPQIWPRIAIGHLAMHRGAQPAQPVRRSAERLLLLPVLLLVAATWADDDDRLGVQVGLGVEPVVPFDDVE